MNAVRVKICGFTRSDDLQAAIDAGTDAVGFVFAERSKRALSLQVAQKLAHMVPAFVCRVGLFMDQDAQSVARVLDAVPLNLLQFHGSENAEYCRRFGLPYIKAVSMDSELAARRAETDFPDAAALLLDSHPVGGLGGTGQVFDWSKIPPSTMPLILAGGLSPENVSEAVARVKPWAVDVSSGVEDEPGVKNAGKMQKFIREAKSEHKC